MDKLKSISVSDEDVLRWGLKKYYEWKKAELEDSAENGLISPETIKIEEVNKEVDFDAVKGDFEKNFGKIQYFLNHSTFNSEGLSMGDPSEFLRNREMSTILTDYIKNIKTHIGAFLLSGVGIVTLALALKNRDNLWLLPLWMQGGHMVLYASQHMIGLPKKVNAAKERGISFSEMKFVGDLEKRYAKLCNKGKLDVREAQALMSSYDTYMNIKLKELYHKMFEMKDTIALDEIQKNMAQKSDN